jgi:hypothetical protein
MVRQNIRYKPGTTVTRGTGICVTNHIYSQRDAFYIEERIVGSNPTPRYQSNTEGTDIKSVPFSFYRQDPFGAGDSIKYSQGSAVSVVYSGQVVGDCV